MHCLTKMLMEHYQDVVAMSLRGRIGAECLQLDVTTSGGVAGYLLYLFVNDGRPFGVSSCALAKGSPEVLATVFQSNVEP